MGRRSSTEVVCLVYQALLIKRTFRQSDLARELEVTLRTLRKILNQLSANGVPLHRDEDPPDVWWSVPRSWMPGGCVISGADAAYLVRLLTRTRRGPHRDAALDRILRGLSGRADAPALAPLAHAVLTSEPSPVEDKHLELVEDSIAQRRTLSIRYLSARSGTADWRHVSPLRVVPRHPARFVAVCHRSDEMRWFRIDGILDGRFEDATPLRTRSDPEVDAYLASSLGGFHDQGEPIDCEFFVRDPEARGVARNLLPGLASERVAGGLRVTARTTALLRLASYVVGLGPAAIAQTPALRDAVLALARGSLAAHAPASADAT